MNSTDARRTAAVDQDNAGIVDHSQQHVLWRRCRRGVSVDFGSFASNPLIDDVRRSIAVPDTKSVPAGTIHAVVSSDRSIIAYMCMTLQWRSSDVRFDRTPADALARTKMKEVWGVPLIACEKRASVTPQQRLATSDPALMAALDAAAVPAAWRDAVNDALACAAGRHGVLAIHADRTQDNGTSAAALLQSLVRLRAYGIHPTVLVFATSGVFPTLAAHVDMAHVVLPTVERGIAPTIAVSGPKAAEIVTTQWCDPRRARSVDHRACGACARKWRVSLASAVPVRCNRCGAFTRDYTACDFCAVRLCIACLDSARVRTIVHIIRARCGWDDDAQAAVCDPLTEDDHGSIGFCRRVRLCFAGLAHAIQGVCREANVDRVETTRHGDIDQRTRLVCASPPAREGAALALSRECEEAVGVAVAAQEQTAAVFVADVVGAIASLLSESFGEAQALAAVCATFYRGVTHHAELWRRLFLQRWPHRRAPRRPTRLLFRARAIAESRFSLRYRPPVFPPGNGPPQASVTRSNVGDLSDLFLLSRRPTMEELRQPPPSTAPVVDGLSPIEDCEFAFKCPLYFEALAALPSEKCELDPARTTEVRFCDVCSKKVYQVGSQQELDLHAARGNCVSFRAADVADGARVEGLTRYVVAGRTDDGGEAAFDHLRQLFAHVAGTFSPELVTVRVEGYGASGEIRVRSSNGSDTRSYRHQFAASFSVGLVAGDDDGTSFAASLREDVVMVLPEHDFPAAGTTWVYAGRPVLEGRTPREHGDAVVHHLRLHRETETFRPGAMGLIIRSPRPATWNPWVPLLASEVDPSQPLPVALDVLDDDDDDD